MSEASEILIYLVDPSLPKVKQYETLAGELSKIADTTFSWRYLLSVLNETVRPSRAFTEALRAHILSLDGVPTIYAKSVPVQVRSKSADIEGAYVMGASKICPKCANKFVPNVPWRRFCPACNPVRSC